MEQDCAYAGMNVADVWSCGSSRRVSAFLPRSNVDGCFRYSAYPTQVAGQKSTAESDAGISGAVRFWMSRYPWHPTSPWLHMRAKSAQAGRSSVAPVHANSSGASFMCVSTIAAASPSTNAVAVSPSSSWTPSMSASSPFSSSTAVAASAFATNEHWTRCQSSDVRSSSNPTTAAWFMVQPALRK